ncbi:MAG: hypothetical protein ACKN97_01255, partial [Acidobacteriota bacterium]
MRVNSGCKQFVLLSLFFSLVIYFGNLPAIAQSESGSSSVEGTVKDGIGAVIPGSTIKIKSADT